MSAVRTRRRMAVAATIGALIAPATAASAGPVPELEELVITVVAAAQRVDVARCRRTLADANKLDIVGEPSPYRVDIPVLDMTLVPPTATDPTAYYLETDSVSAKVPDYCPAGVKVVLWLADAAPAQPFYSNLLNPARSDQPGRLASKQHTLKVPYVGPNAQRIVSEITVHAEAWNGRDSTGKYPATAGYFCREFHYTVLGAGARPRQDGVHDCTAKD